jgi:hypothetical protein
MMKRTRRAQNCMRVPPPGSDSGIKPKLGIAHGMLFNGRRGLGQLWPASSL